VANGYNMIEVLHGFAVKRSESFTFDYNRKTFEQNRLTTPGRDYFIMLKLLNVFCIVMSQSGACGRAGVRPIAYALAIMAVHII